MANPARISSHRHIIRVLLVQFQGNFYADILAPTSIGRLLKSAGFLAKFFGFFLGYVSPIREAKNMSIQMVTWGNAHQCGEAWISHHRLRHRLFVQRLGWDVPTHEEFEYDQFDTPAAVYLLWCDEHGHARGAVRLIPTTRPYMIKELWPDMAGDTELPSNAQTWEATRLGVDRDLSPALRRRVLGELIVACLEFGMAHGLNEFLCVMPVAILKGVLARSGCAVELLGCSKKMAGHDVAAARVPVSHEILDQVRQRRDIPETVLHHRIEDIMHPSSDMQVIDRLAA
ncbi:MAG: acyl-homoserine-lactone synthase [Geminicoccaceae bacterium]